MGITLDNFIYVTIYISFLNSFLEEFFYRGYAFITLKKHLNRKISYIFSASLFAIYHIGMILESFIFPDIILVVIGLFLGFSGQVVAMLVAILVTLLYLVIKRIKEIPFGYYLSIATAITIIILPHITEVLEVINFIIM